MPPGLASAGYHKRKAKDPHPQYEGSWNREQTDFERALIAEDWDKVQALVEEDQGLVHSKTWRGATPLIEAARVGRTEMVTWLLEKGADINHASDAGATALSEAALMHQWQTVYLLLRRGADAKVSSTTNGYSDILQIAARGGDVEVLKELVKLGVDHAAVAGDGTDLMLAAAGAGHIEMIKYALELGHSANRGRSLAGGHTPALEAASRGHFEAMSLLLAHGGRLRRADTAAAEGAGDASASVLESNEAETVARAFSLAISNGNLHHVQMLADGGVDVNARDWSGDSVLADAARSGSVEIVNWLLARGAKIENTNDRGESALHVAVAAGKLDTTLALLDAGADLHATNKEKMGVAHYAALSGELELLKALAERGAATDELNSRLDSPLLLGARRGHADVVQWLLERGSRADVVGSRGDAGAILAVRARSERTLALLLNAGASPTLANQKGETPLHEAARIGARRALAMLVWRIAHGGGAQIAEGGVEPESAAVEPAEGGAEALREALEARNSNSDTPLLIAAMAGSKQLAQLLISYGADQEAKDEHGTSAAELLKTHADRA